MKREFYGNVHRYDVHIPENRTNEESILVWKIIHMETSVEIIIITIIIHFTVLL